MKKLISLVFISVVISSALQAQDFKRFRVATGLGYAMPGGDGAKAGVCIYLEPGYRISDQILVGLRIESALVARGFSEDVDSASDFDIAGIASYAMSGQYYFSNRTFRPFAGIGFGLYSLSAIKVDVGAGTQDLGKAESKFGAYPRVGFDVGHFSLQLEYNLIPATKVEGLSGEFRNSYLGIKIGGFFGGGRKI